MFDLEDNEIRVVAQVIDTITADYPVDDLGDIQSMPFLNGLKLADPTLGTPGRIDLLLGVTNCNRCMEDGQSFSDDKLLVAQKTIFGWAVGGVLLVPTLPEAATSHLPATKQPMK